MFDMIHSGNCETIKAMGRSDIFLAMEIIKKTGYFIVISLFVWLSNSPQMLAMSFIICTGIATIVNAIPNKKLIGYKLRLQCYDLLPNLITSILMCVMVMAVGCLAMPPMILLALQIVVGVVAYIAMNVLVRNSSLIYLIKFAKNMLKGK